MDEHIRTAKLDKIRKLFAQAQDVAGTPEADAFNLRAFDLLARYGIDEAEARRTSGTGLVGVRCVELVPTGPYVPSQVGLLTGIAGSLHCYTLRQRRPDRVLVWGVAGHVTRVKLLWSVLVPQMLAGAGRMRPEPGERVAVKVYRSSWMRGFTGEIERRLSGAERHAAAQSRAPGMELELITDADRAARAAQEWARSQGKKIVTPRSRLQHSRTASEHGRNAATRVDLGQTGLGSRRALEP